MARRIALCLLISLLPACALTAGEADSAAVVQPQPRKKSVSKLFSTLYGFVKEFSRVDTNYVEPQHYNFTFMLQNTNTYEVYHLRNKAGQEVVFSPRPAYKLGPYFGWRWIFLGYTFDLAHLKNGDGRQDLNLSLYSNQIGVDLFYRKSGDSYRVTRLAIAPDKELNQMKNQPFGGFHSSVKGFNLYYIFNHRRFSYPAAYSQSTVQRRSAGSPIVGIGYTEHKLDIDWQELEDLTKEKTGRDYPEGVLDTAMVFSNVNYKDYSFSGGYAYNWVFARNWLFDISLQAALAYKHSKSETNTTDIGFLRTFDFRNINIDGILRTGVVWNNTKWYVGANSIFHAYSYRKSHFSTNNIFGSVNVYVGFNFGKR